MQLGLSGRLIEAGGGYTLPIDDFLQWSRELGFDGVEIRYPQLPLETPADQQDHVAARLRALELTWVFGTVEGLVGEDALARAVGMMNLHNRCGCRFTRFSVSQPEHIAWARRFADEAARLGRRLIMQLHNGTLADTVPRALETLRLIDRANVGVAYEPCHLRFAGCEAYTDGIRALGDRLFCVSLQNYKAADPGDSPESRVMVNGQAYVRAWPGAPAGIDFGAVIRTLRAAGFDGFATVMADAAPGQDREALARRYLEVCRAGR